MVDSQDTGPQKILMTIFCIMHMKAVKRRQNPVGICGEPCIYKGVEFFFLYERFSDELCTRNEHTMCYIKAYDVGMVYE